MKKLNVIDLDKTLIKVDSLFIYIKKTLFLKPINYKLFYLVCLRIFKLISSEIFLENYLLEVNKNINYASFLDSFTNYILKFLNLNIIEKIKQHSDDNTIIVICSASPEDYVKRISDSFGYYTIASKIYNTKFIRCYGQAKYSLINLYYPESDYIYNFAISDSKSDLKLLSYFKYSELIDQ